MKKRFDYLNKITDYIERHMNDEIDLKAVAGEGAVSLMQLYRDFYAYTGHSVKEYIRKRRLSNACAMIKHTGAPLVDIALSNGYETQQAFNKHFKNVLGVTPVEYKNGGTHFFFYPQGRENISLPVRVETEAIPEAVVCKYYSAQLKGIENRAVSVLMDVIERHGAPSCGEVRLFGREGGQRRHAFCYELLFSPGENIGAWQEILYKSGFHEVSASGRTEGVFASCTVRNSEQAIADGWDYLYNSWLNNSMFEPDDRGYFEEYCLRGRMPVKLKLFLPVRRKTNYRTVTVGEMPERTFVVARRTGPDAERVASEYVISFLKERYPSIINEAVRFYIACSGDECECGVELGNDASDISLPASGGVGIVRYPGCMYARLDDNCCADAGLHVSELERWLAQNGLSYGRQKIFTVYEAENGSFETADIKMTVFAPVKIVKKG